MCKYIEIVSTVSLSNMLLPVSLQEIDRLISFSKY